MSMGDFPFGSDDDVEGEWRGVPIYSEPEAAVPTVKTLTSDAAEVQAIRFQAVYRPVLGDYLSLTAAELIGDTVFSLRSTEGDAVIGMVAVSFNPDEVAFTLKGLIAKDCPDRLLLETHELGISLSLRFDELSGFVPVVGYGTFIQPTRIRVGSVTLRRELSLKTDMKIVPMSWDFT